MNNNRLILIVMDGWGISKNPNNSAISKAKTPFIDECYKYYPNSIIKASGIDVGLPHNQVGNSEVGHLNLGAGRIIYQNLLKINMDIKSNNSILEKNLKQIFLKSKHNNSNIHVVGLISDGGVHSHINHLFYIIKIAYIEKIKNIYIHGFTDGRDVDPKSSIKYIKSINNFCNHYNTGTLSTIIGRYYSMDRDKKWNRIKKSYDLMVHGIGKKTNNIYSTINDYYQQKITDEFIEPIVLIDKNNRAYPKIQNNDIVISFNFRNDRMRQITEVLTQKNIFDMKKLNLHYVSMTNYNKNFKKIKTIFKNNNIPFTLGEVLSNNQKTQLRIAESEKYPHVTFFFSGGREKPFPLEKRVVFQSPLVSTYDLAPKMSAKSISNQTIDFIKKKSFDFICLNFANPDMVGHTGNMNATIIACEYVDYCVKMICYESLKNNYCVVLLSDHGNADFMINEDGTPNTSHTNQPVPCFLIQKTINKKIKNGTLADIAPTILDIMSIKKPESMSGSSLLI